MRSDYAYITGKIRQLENGLPDETDLERMIDAPDAPAAFAVLNDTDYAKHLLDVEPEDYYSALHNDWRDVRRLLDTAVPDKLLLDILYLREDFNNLKLVLKTHLLGQDLSRVKVTDAGSVSKADWLSYFTQHLSGGPRTTVAQTGHPVVRDEARMARQEPKTSPGEESDEPDYDSETSYSRNRHLKGAGFTPETRSRLSKFWERIILEILQRVGGQPLSQVVDRVADKIYFKTYKDLAVKFKNKFIIMLAEIEIDVMNVKALLRARRLKRRADWLHDQLAEGGYIKVSEIVSWLELETTELLQRFRHRLPYTIYQEIEKGQGSGVTEIIEHAMYTWRRRYLRRARYVAYGPEVVMRYFYAKIRAMINVRLAMAGKLNNLKPEEIKQRIRL